MPILQMTMNGNWELRRKAREKLQSGNLPTAAAGTWAGAGSGAACALCELPIPHNDVEYEIEVNAAAGVQVFKFHMRCHYVWSIESRHR